MNEQESKNISRREMLKLSLMAGSATLIGAGGVREVLAASCHDSTIRTSCGDAIEVHPTSPLIGGRIVVTTKGNRKTFSVDRGIGKFDAFTQELPIPEALRPTSPVGGANTGDVQDSDGIVHQVGVDSDIVTSYPGWNQTPLHYRIKIQEAEHSFTNLKAVPINAAGNVVLAPPAFQSGPEPGALNLPKSTIWGFNGTFPGPMINAEYGRPCLVRFENDLPSSGPVPQDFGAPDKAFLTHLHNAHTAPESDGNSFHKPCPYGPGQWVNNLYLNWPAGGDDREKQSFYWFHDHRMDHTGANVYKGMVGLYPIYDPVLDPGDERLPGLHLPGIRTNKSDGSFDVKYDIPLAFYDCRLDDGVTPHQDFHNGCGQTHPEWWGKTYFKHFPDHGFVGDIFTVNGVACPVMHVKRRKYRFRFLDASISRQYEFKLMTGNVAAAPGQQGQYNFVDGRGRNTLGRQVMRFRQIATDGGLMQFPIDRDSIQIWPAKRREVIIDFTRYQDGSPTTNGEVIYLANIAQMLDGRKRTEPRDKGADPNYCVPVLKFVIDGDPDEPDQSVMPALNQQLRELPPLPDFDTLPRRRFVFNKEDVGGELLWTINGHVFDPARVEANPKLGRPELWTFVNAGGGWTHPIHIHMEEHRILSRDGRPAQGEDRLSREDVVSLEGGEEVTFYRNFRTFTGKYVAHCHNLAHEDHAMMFGWTIER
jgi:FtsP/CotA-like multicopper oxidase with cupredoxin domain